MHLSRGIRHFSSSPPSPSTLASVFSHLVYARRSGGRLDASRPVDLETVRSLVSLTARAPSGFNMQPYTVVLVDDARVRGRVAEGMLGVGNVERTLGAPLVAVFAADLDAQSSVAEVQEMEARAGQRSAGYLRSLPVGAAAFSSSQQGGCAGSAASAVGAAALSSLSALSGMPLPPLGTPGMAWAYKQTAMAAMVYMLAATSLGLATHPMEGLDPARVAQAVGLSSSRWSVPLVITTGYPAALAPEGRGPAPPTPRRMAVFKHNKASKPFPLE